MPEFQYTVRTADGVKEEGSIASVDETEAVRILQGKGCTVLSVTGGQGKGVSKSSKRVVEKEIKRKNKISSDDFLLFFDQLAVLLDSGIDIIRALDIVSLQATSKPLYDAITSMKTDVTGGLGLSEAMAKFPKFFPRFVRGIIQVGEQSGELPMVIERVAQNIERVDEVRQKIKKALTYPLLLVFFSIVAIAVFLLKIIPTFVKIFAEFDIELPKMTLFVMGLSDIFRHYFFLLMGAAVLIVIAVRKILQIPRYRVIFDENILKVPYLGSLLLKSAVANFSTSLEMMLKNGVSVLEALHLAKDSLRNTYLEGLMDRVRDRVKEGSTISSQLQKIPVFPMMMVQMIGVGEESGRLVDMLKKLSQFYNKRVSEAVDSFAAIFEPLILVFVGGVIGVLVIAMFLPIFKMASIGG